MKKGFILLTLLIFFGCVQTVKITVEPEDAKIFVDGEYLGKGNVSFEAGLTYDIPKSHIIQLTHKDFETFQTEIKNKLDVGAATLYAGLNMAMGIGVMLLEAGYAIDNPYYEPDYTYSYIVIGISPIYYLISYKFKDVYSYHLTKSINE